MSVYAPTPGFADRRRHPTALTAIVAVHALAIAAVMTAKMDLPAEIIRTPTIIDFIDPPKPPPPPPPEPTPEPRQQQPQDSVIDRNPPIVDIPIADIPPVDSRDIPIPPLDVPIGPTIDPLPRDPGPIAEPVRVGPRFATPADAVRPPYPDSKRRLEEEASLRLRLSIDPRGRVVAVEPVGAVDRTFFDAARKHILARWRYKPATEDGRAVASSTVITLKFELED